MMHSIRTKSEFYMKSFGMCFLCS